MQPVEVGDAVDAEQHRLAIDHERAVPVSQRGLGDQRIAIAPVVTVAGEQPHALAVALNDQAIAVVLDFVDPLRPVRDFGAAGGNAGFERGFGHAGKIGNGRLNANLRAENLPNQGIIGA